MGTRADFYIGKGKDAEWLGSVGWDGHPESFPNIIGITDEKEYREAVLKELKGRDDGTLPDMGWPWPWEDSRTTDYAIAFFDDKVWASCFGHEFFDPLKPPEDDYTGKKTKKFPTMTKKRTAPPTLGPRSGLLTVVSTPKKER